VLVATILFVIKQSDLVLTGPGLFDRVMLGRRQTDDHRRAVTLCRAEFNSAAVLHDDLSHTRGFPNKAVGRLLGPQTRHAPIQPPPAAPAA